MLDADLAMLYGVETRRLNEQVRRNIERFPEDFMFQLTPGELSNLMSQIATSSSRSQIATLNTNWGGVRKLPFAFTEQGVAMLSGVLRSPVAIKANIEIMRAFVAMRNYLVAATQTSKEIAELRLLLEENMGAVNDLSEDTRKEISGIWDAIVALSQTPKKDEKPRNPIGFNIER